MLSVSSQQWVKRLEISRIFGEWILDQDNQRMSIENIVEVTVERLLQLKTSFDNYREGDHVEMIRLSDRLSVATNAIIDKRVEKRDRFYYQVLRTIGKIISFLLEWTGFEIFSSRAMGLNDNDFMEDIRLLRQRIESHKINSEEVASWEAWLMGHFCGVEQVIERARKAMPNIIEACNNRFSTEGVENAKTLLDFPEDQFDRDINRGINIHVDDSLNLPMPSADLKGEAKIQAYHQYFSDLAQEDNEWVNILKKTLNQTILNEQFAFFISRFAPHIAEKWLEDGSPLLFRPHFDKFFNFPPIHLKIHRNQNGIEEVEIRFAGGLDLVVEGGSSIRDNIVTGVISYKVRLNETGNFVVADYHAELTDNLTLGG